MLGRHSTDDDEAAMRAVLPPPLAIVRRRVLPAAERRRMIYWDAAHRSTFRRQWAKIRFLYGRRYALSFLTAGRFNAGVADARRRCGDD